MKYDVSKRGLSEYTNNKIECKTCGHTQATGKRDRVICKHCGNYIYKDDRTEFKYKIMEKQIKERRKYDKFLEGQKRKELFKVYPPKYVYCHSSRQQCAKDGRFDLYKATTQFYAWYVWEKGYSGDTIIKWI